jgi:hypothetical protein
LSLAYSPNNIGGDSDSLTSVKFSQDCQYLYAGGEWGKNGHFSVRMWPNAGKGDYHDLTTGNDSKISSLVSLKDGSIVIAAADPS